ncbi:nicotinate (nicotinamide) nucleotide adenylyltransferase [Sulfurihydrogenibium azorense]|uniref:Probable nicotinate-nucleotide adenylyltransferase n=1 Tax=Sulfurihydrogenibium azorense (strain DSM 15241 / OCM 825 / Az-Fu1) TaxID=204536 RepID=C1DUX0_SULAA|nr:nicotinate (nicotinamide) nucleotide adenylyltransferase [Sulfurihydrogenibium azorense]ACN98369.1 nicotinate-nucleotide adenylyltransferase [Sulfurihydrogenibium azorense Az-Fu1]MDM7274193.1 nicotinate (nicotinamide) nucleotide adenylyltransferase [Sulfurihydrogenibium azorense]
MIALFGGSFDPVHLGHLRIAEDVREFFNLKKVIFVPAYLSPLKESSNASAEDRFNMLTLSIKDNPYFEVSDYEIKKGGKSYTIETVEHYERLFYHKPVLILGSDSLLTLHKWKKPEDLLKKANFIVVGRGKDSYKEIKNYLNTFFNFNNIFYNESIIKEGVYFFDSRRIDISSTEIRERVKLGKSIKYLVLEEVENYIKEKNLYKNSP